MNIDQKFEEYISNKQNNNIYLPKLIDKLKKFPTNIQDMYNVILYGPPGTGKYTYALQIIKKYSPKKLLYESKLNIVHQKQSGIYKISDIHYEIDMSILGCNSKMVWNDIYTQIVDIVSTTSHKHGIILCKNFHNINTDLLDNFYSYIQFHPSSRIKILFILLTEHLSMIPTNITNTCSVINIPRPSKQMYLKNIKPIHSNPISKNINISDITNIKHLMYSTDKTLQFHKIHCDKILDQIFNMKNIKFLVFRNLMYDIFIYNLNIHQCVWYIFSSVISHTSKSGNISYKQYNELIYKTFVFFKYYNNNYRPIYHIENYFIYLSLFVQNRLNIN